ncbi:hypothetical protein [Streptosporangium vulgare]|uniref:HTH cro/C1-type domain-containing protein n=1 Tax=Streptosporangium vulgare TaxID=46190 RepID=A0ABV5TIT6_9ACTN
MILLSGKGYQALLDCRRRGRHLRQHGFTVDQIAVVLSLDHAVTPLRLYRYAAGLTAAEVVAAFTRHETAAHFLEKADGPWRPRQGPMARTVSFGPT